MYPIHSKTTQNEAMWNFSSACYAVTEAWVTSHYLFYALETKHPYSLVKISVQQLNTDKKTSFSINITLHLTYRSHDHAPSNIPKGLESFLEPALRSSLWVSIRNDLLKHLPNFLGSTSWASSG